MPLPRLREKGVTLVTGTDSVIDHWSPFGTADMSEKANLCAQIYAGGDEWNLSRALTIATGDIRPLDDDGGQLWPTPALETRHPCPRHSRRIGGPEREAVGNSARQARLATNWVWRRLPDRLRVQGNRI
jgi:hypothetical protein